MKVRAFIIVLATWLVLPSCHGQDWIDSNFSLDTTIRLSATDIPEDLSHLKYNIIDGVFYYTDMQAFQNKLSNYQATIYGLSLGDYARTKIVLPFPTKDFPAEKTAQTFWINDFDIEHDTIILSVQNHILRYHKNSTNDFVFDTSYSHQNVKEVYLHRGSLYYFEENHDSGFKWFRISSKCAQPELILELSYEAPHVVQAAPNRYLFHDNHYVYFLSTRYPNMKKYDLDGHWIEDVTFDLPNWHPFEDEYIQKSLSYPYGIERIQATIGEIFKFSYPKYVFPIGGDYLLYYTQFDSIAHKTSPYYALTSTSKTTLFQNKDYSDSTYGRLHFPFYLFNAIVEKARISWNDKLVEIILDDTSTWTGLRPTEYEQRREDYFRKHDPIPSIRIMTYRNSSMITKPFFYDYEKSFKSISDLPIGKNIILINNALECSACRNELLTALNEMDSSIHIGILYPFFPGALQQREMAKEIGRYLNRDFKLYFLDSKMHAKYPRYITSACSTFPGILFHETGKVPVLFSVDSIFDDNPTNIIFSQEFQSFWNDFKAK